jgi:pimeloyl-ACP methyl ester carboxylesterase
VIARIALWRPGCPKNYRMSDYLLVHGGFGVGWVWDEVVKRLETAGHRAHVVDQLPSVGAAPASLGDLSADASYVRRMLDGIDEPIVLVGHSYGGMVMTELADHPKVRHTVYVTALWPERGQTAMNLLGDVLPPVINRRDDGALAVTEDFDLAWKAFCPDLERDRAQEVLSRFVQQSDSSFVAPSTAPLRTHPTTYVVAALESDDSVAAQEASAAKADYVVQLPAAHMVQLSRPIELAEALGQI